MIMLEAMSYGVLPVASNGNGAMRWLVDSGFNGFICRLDKWEQGMRDCLVYLRDNPEKLYEMRSAARDRFLCCFVDQMVARRVVKLLRSPTVDRTHKKKNIKILRWHRPLAGAGDKAPFMDRLCIRAGWLRQAGNITLK